MGKGEQKYSYGESDGPVGDQVIIPDEVPGCMTDVYIRDPTLVAKVVQHSFRELLRGAGIVGPSEPLPQLPRQRPPSEA